MSVVAVIPARYASTRFPGKPLASDTGKFLVQHVYESVARASRVDRVIVATDDQRILDAVQSFGGEVAMTRADHATGTERVAEVAERLDCDVVVNVQGDEPEIEPAAIDRLADVLDSDAGASIATLACPFAVLADADPGDPHAVKVVLDVRGRAIYFSRAAIPHPRIHETAGRTHLPAPYLLHLGVYGYRRPFLGQLASMVPTPLERTEMLEQLRWLEHGHAISVGIVDRAAVGIDTPADYAAFVARCRASTGVR